MKFRVVALISIMMLASPALAGVKEGVDAWQAGNYAKAITEWRGPAEAGDPDAQFNLGQAYKLGRGVTTDLKVATDWYLKAANQGHEQAQANLGLILFQNGDRRGALPWLQKAADRGEPRAQYVLGTAHFNGDLVTRDWPRAYALMTRAAASGLPQAATSLAQMDQFIPLAQRQQGIALAKDMDRTTQIAAASPPSPSPTAPVAKAAIKPVAVPASAAPPPPAAKPAPKPETKVAVSTSAKPVAPPAPKPEPKPAPAAPASGNSWRVQLGAFGTDAAARTAWEKLSTQASGLKGLQPYLVKVGTVTRLQAGPLASRTAAAEACKTATGTGCFPVAP